MVIDPDGPGPVRAFDPCLWHDPDGRLWLFWAQGYAGHTDEGSGVWAITTRESHQAEPRWSAPVRLCDGIMMNKPTVLSSGEWLLPVASWGTEGSAGVYSSADRGRSWSFLGQANIPREEDRNCDEHMIVERQGGELWMWVRTGYGIGHSVSEDRGQTWTPVEPSEIPHPASRFFVRRLSSGRLLLVKHGPMDRRTGRSHLTAFLSDDDGRSWSDGLLLDDREGVSYTDGVEGVDGTIHVVYDYERRGAKEILIASFTEDEAIGSAGRALGEERRELINKATGENPEKYRRSDCADRHSYPHHPNQGGGTLPCERQPLSHARRADRNAGRGGH
jgi:hypothetical protein